MTAKATAPVPGAEVITCEDCDKEINARSGAHCDACFDAAVEHDVEVGLTEIQDNQPPVGKELREWAARCHLMGQISREVREQLELCADDIEVGHG